RVDSRAGRFQTECCASAPELQDLMGDCVVLLCKQALRDYRHVVAKRPADGTHEHALAISALAPQKDEVLRLVQATVKSQPCGDLQRPCQIGVAMHHPIHM